MANEAVIVELLGTPPGCPVRFTVSGADAIAKGTICVMDDERRAGPSAGLEDIFAGIAATEKVLADGSTSLALYTKGIFDLYSDGGTAIAVGDHVVISGANIIRKFVTEDDEEGKVIGKSMGVVAATVAETVTVAVGVYP